MACKGSVWQRPCLRFGVYLIEEAAPVLARKHAREPPWLLLKRLHVYNLDEQHVARLRGLDLERPAQVVDFGEVDVLDVVGAVVVLDLPARPVDAFDLDRFAVLDGACEGDCWEVGVSAGFGVGLSATYCRGASGSGGC